MVRHKSPPSCLMRQEGIPPTLFCYKLFAFNMKVNIYITSINKETYIGLKIDDFYFNNEDSGYHVKLNNELNDKRKAVIYGVNTDGSLLILDCSVVLQNN